METRNIQKLTILPFETSVNSALQTQAADWLTNEARNRVQDTGYFTMINPSTVERLQKRNRSLEKHVDAIFEGRIISLVSRDGSRQTDRVDSETGERRIVTVYMREVELEFHYSIVSSRDGEILGSQTKKDRISVNGEDRSMLNSQEELLREIISRNMTGIGTFAASIRNGA